MNYIFLLDHKPLDHNVKRTLRNYVGNNPQQLRPSIRLALDGTPEHGIRRILFDSDKDVDEFLALILEPAYGRNIKVFTTMPAELLAAFHNKFFKIVKENKRFTFTPTRLEEGYRMYEKRFFTITYQDIAAFAQETNEIKLQVGPDGYERRTYKCYVFPILNSSDSDIDIKKLYYDTGRMPLALPAGEALETNDYYFRKPEVDIRTGFRAIINKTANNLGVQSSFFRLLELTEKGVYRELLNDGGYWTFRINPIPSKELSRLEGETQLAFYFSQGSDDFSLAKWRTNLLTNTEEDSEEITEIKQAIIGDMEIEFRKAVVHGIQPPFPLMKSFSNRFAANSPNEVGLIELIEELMKDFPTTEKNYILELLKPYRAPENSSNGDDEIRALRMFAEHFFKCPLSPEFELAWNEVLLKFFIKRKGFYTIEDVLTEYRLKDGNPGLNIENAPQGKISIKTNKSDHINSLRLLLPPGSSIELMSSNVLDTSNCLLDNNLILK